MPMDVDLLLDRRRLKRRLSIWRAVAVAAVVFAVLLTAGRGTGGVIAGPHVARLTVSGVITDNRKLVEAVEALADDASASALIVYVDSPGGAVSGGEALTGAIAKVAAVKPVAAVMAGTAASAGFMVCMPAARVFAREGTLTGSIGVILETGEVSGLFKMLGVTAEAITSGPLKDQPSFFKPLSPEGRDELHGLVMDYYDQFVTLVANGRHMDKDRVRELADGRAYTGRQALKLGLIDQIGGEGDARAWLASDMHVPSSLPVADVRARAGWAGRMLGDDSESLLGGLWKAVVSQGLRLDGAWAIWQP